MYLFIHNNFWTLHRKDGLLQSGGEFCTTSLWELMSNDDIEEYPSPKFVLGDLVEVPLGTYGTMNRIGQITQIHPVTGCLTIDGCSQWIDPDKVKLHKGHTMSVDCTICSRVGKHFCDECIHGIKYKQATNYYDPMPNRRKDLNWQEAHDAWKQGWEVITQDNSLAKRAGPVNFNSDDNFCMSEILNGIYQLTGRKI